MSNEFIPPLGIAFRLCGLASDRVLFSRFSPPPEVSHNPKREVCPDQWFVAIPGSGQYTGCYAIKSKVTGNVLFSRKSPDPRVGHVGGDGTYADNWFKFEAGSGKYAGYFRLRAVASDTVLVSRTSTGTDSQLNNYPANDQIYDDQYFTALPEFIPPPGIAFRLCGLASDRVLFSRFSPSPEVSHTPKSEVYPDQWFVAIPGSGQYTGCYAIKSKVTGNVLFSRQSPDPHVGHVGGDGIYADNWFKFEAGSGKYAGYFRLRAVASDTVLVSRTPPDNQLTNFPANNQIYDDQYFTALIMPNSLTPPSKIPFRLCGLASDRVLYSRISSPPEVSHYPKSEVYPDQWFVAIPGSGQYAGCYAIKSKVTGNVLFSRRSPDPLVGHVGGDGTYADNWFKFEAGSGKYAGYFRLHAVASDTVLVSRTSPDPQVLNHPASEVDEVCDDQYFTALFDRDQLVTGGHLNFGSLQYAYPRIVTLDASLLPTPPGGWKFANLVNPSKPDSDLSRYPVLLFGSYTYTALSSVKDDNRMKIVAWDMDRNLVKELEKPGARYLWNITFNAGNETVTFNGQYNQSIQATLDELVVRPAVVYLPSSSGPILPYTLTYAAADPSRFPVIKNGPHSFWPASFKDGRNSFCIAVADRNNFLQRLIECPGGKVIRDIQVNDAQRTIWLIGQDGSKATFNYDTALTCFYHKYNFTKDDFLVLAKELDLPLSDTDAASLATAMPQIDCTFCCQIKGPQRPKRSVGGAIVGVILGSLSGAAAGFFILGPAGVGGGLIAGGGIGLKIGLEVPSRGDTRPYKLSDLERTTSLVGYSQFPCGPFDNTGIWENIIDTKFPRYQELLYSGAVVKPSKGSTPQAYSPATKSVGAFPRDPRYKPFTVASTRVQITKYIFVIVKTAETIDGKPGYQMRINPEDFYPDTWSASQRVNHSQLTDGYRIWALIGNPHMQAYAAGSLYVDITNQKFLGIDTRTGHYFTAFAGQDKQVNDATLQFLANLGYSTSGMLDYTDIYGYLQSPM